MHTVNLAALDVAADALPFPDVPELTGAMRSAAAVPGADLGLIFPDAGSAGGGEPTSGGLALLRRVVEATLHVVQVCEAFNVRPPSHASGRCPTPR